MLQARSHFADKENAHGSTSLYPKTPARGLSAGTRDPNLAGSKTVGRAGLSGKPGEDMGNGKLTMTTRTGKGKEKMQGGGGGKGGKGGGGGDEGEGIGQYFSLRPGPVSCQ